MEKNTEESQEPGLGFKIAFIVFSCFGIIGVIWTLNAGLNAGLNISKKFSQIDQHETYFGRLVEIMNDQQREIDQLKCEVEAKTGDCRESTHGGKTIYFRGSL